MNIILKAFMLFLISNFYSSCIAATIDEMYTSTFGGYEQTYQPNGTFMIFGQANHYVLNDGSIWESGAGSHPDAYAYFDKYIVEGNTIKYFFKKPENGILFTDTDYDSGEHSSQGTLKAPMRIVLVAKLNSTKGVIRGYTTLLSNDATWYGEPRFNYYSASVGDKVFFKQVFSLIDATFTTSLFNKQFRYNLTGFVSFLKKKPQI